LREPKSALKRANAIIITRADHVSQEEIRLLEAEIKGFNPDAVLLRSNFKSEFFNPTNNEQVPMEKIRGSTVVAVSGIGNPEAFESEVRELALW